MPWETEQDNICIWWADIHSTSTRIQVINNTCDFLVELLIKSISSQDLQYFLCLLILSIKSFRDDNEMTHLYYNILNNFYRASIWMRKMNARNCFIVFDCVLATLVLYKCLAVSRRVNQLQNEKTVHRIHLEINIIMNITNCCNDKNV